jgi:hypothetical protein
MAQNKKYRIMKPSSIDKTILGKNRNYDRKITKN